MLYNKLLSDLYYFMYNIIHTRDFRARIVHRDVLKKIIYLLVFFITIEHSLKGSTGYSMAVAGYRFSLTTDYPSMADSTTPIDDRLFDNQLHSTTDYLMTSYWS